LVLLPCVTPVCELREKIPSLAGRMKDRVSELSTGEKSLSPRENGDAVQSVDSCEKGAKYGGLPA